ncbi:MAG TPA: CDP-alcohol phosphatidyltransferase family protein [Thermoanaerobaculia bacterium]|nr:CDP-alcohol phosphatidyltransferase family protein [Thermoanaerobaculia bacterium]
MSDLRGRVGGWLVPVARRSPLSPNTLTLLALASNLAAAAALASAGRWAWGYPTAILLATAGGTLDILDGVVARVQGLASRWGDFLDHVSDRISDVALLTGWIVGAGVSAPIGLLALIGVMLNGYAGTQIEASFGTREYHTTGRVEYYAAILGFPMLAWLGGAKVEATRVAGLPLLDLLTLALAVFALIGVGQRLVHARSLARRADSSRPPVK